MCRSGGLCFAEAGPEMPATRAFGTGTVLDSVINSVDYLWIKGRSRIPVQETGAHFPFDARAAAAGSLLTAHGMVTGDGDPVERVHGDRQPTDS
jgi:hypothetical protein